MRRTYALFGGLAIGLAAIVPVSSAGAGSPTKNSTPAAAESSPSRVAESPSGSYIVLLKADPLVITLGQDQLTTTRGINAANAMRSTHDRVLSKAGVSTELKVHDYTSSLNGFSLFVDHSQAIKIARDPAVSMVLADDLRQVTADGDGVIDGNVVVGDVPTVNEFLGLTGPGGAYQSGITGEAVLVGIIDTGIWPEHPSFADDGTYPKAPKLNSRGGVKKCDFGNQQHNAADVTFKCNNKLVGARQIMDTYRAQVGAEPDEFDSARDDDGHGTHTASTAAGNAGVDAKIYGRYIDRVSGIAPRAQIIAYKALGNGGGFTSDLAAAIDQAVYDGVDVINYSIGGGAQLVSADTIAFLYAQQAGVFVAVSAGNSGPGAETVGGPGDVPWVTTVGASTNPRFYEGLVTLGNGTTIQGASVTHGLVSTALVDAAAAGSELCEVGDLDPAVVTGKIVLCKRGRIGRVEKSLAVQVAGGVGMILYNPDVPCCDNLFTDDFWVPSVHVDGIDGLAIKQYIADSAAAATAAISVGRITELDYAPSIAAFSSRGPNLTEASVIKPDITAPGIQILAGASPYPDPDAPQGELFQAIAGTSMSSPHIAGVYALLKQAHPNWTAAAAKSAIMTTAYQNVVKNDRVTPADPFDMGAGHVNPGLVAAPGSMFNPGLVYPAGFNQYLGFLCDSGPEIFANAAATCASLAAAGIPTRARDLNLASIGIDALAGSETVTRTVTNTTSSALTFIPSFDLAGFTAVTNPATLVLAPGATTTYTLTIKNDGNAAIDEWTFGGLTWTSGKYIARSPIAVKAVAIDAPAEVVGTGVEGSAKIPVKFGYNGDYSPAAHGLVAATATPGTIGQDPDKTPFTSDDGAGLDLIPFVVGAAAYARWEVVLPGDDDLDLYLLDPAGNLVAQSTNGGTDEVIELLLPVAGTYTLAVHGWAVVSATDLPYTVDSWVIPADPDADNGSLVITGAPDAAAIGATGTVDVSWTGLTAGTQYYGAISHSDGTNLLGLTLVAVDA